MHRFGNAVGLWLCLLICLLPRFVQCRDRVYYVAAVDEEWDYAPSGVDLGNPNSRDADVVLQNAENRIGRIYTKAVYKQYTDSTYQTEIPKPEWLGLYGPILKGEEGDTIVVHFKNFAFREFTMHPHGAMYTKDSEGALYVDGTSGNDKHDDTVLPGTSYTYRWLITDEQAPAAGDPDCLSWLYHSHIDPARDTSSGLMGPLLTCKRGVLNEDGSRRDGTRDIVLVFTIFEEDISWYIERNLRKCSNIAACENLFTTGDSAFKKSNLMYSVNGYTYANLPGLAFCQGEKVWWHLIGMGSEVDVHTIFFRGQTLLYNENRMDTVPLFAAIFKTASMIIDNPGQWLISCQVHNHFNAGMKAFMRVDSCQAAGGTTTERQMTPDRTYYIAAFERIWDYAPTVFDNFDHHGLLEPGTNSRNLFTRDDNKIGRRYKKAVYQEYTDDTFRAKKQRPSSDNHLGFLGPVIAAEVGETVDIVFKNLASRSYSIHLHGVKYESTPESVTPGETHTYRFSVPASVAPSSHDPDCLTYSYHSEVDMVKDINSGLTGPMLVCKQGTLNSNNRQIKQDREFFLMSSIANENLSWYILDNINTFCENPHLVDVKDPVFFKSNIVPNINGYSFANLPGLEMCVQENVSWHLIGQGSQVDVHALYFHGNTLTHQMDRVDTLSLFPDNTKTAYMYTDNPGTWPVVCVTTEHFVNGMTGYYSVNTCGKVVTLPQMSDSVRTYYIGATEIEWDYAPIKRDIITGNTLLNPQSSAYKFVRDDAGYIGSIYKKAVFREYTNATFQHEIPRTGADQHLGLLGPTIRAEVGDTLYVHFRNMASRPFSLYSHGVMHQLVNGTHHESSMKQIRSGVSPGQSLVYEWFVPERAGPAAGDPNCIVWLYYSMVNTVRDKHSGLVGALVVCRKGYIDSVNDRNMRNDVDREITLLFSIFNENLSWYIGDNIRQYAPEIENSTATAAFINSNKYTSINGYVYANNEGLIMRTGDRVAWYLLGLGSKIDIHTVHFHGQVLIKQTGGSPHMMDVIDVFPETTACLEMLATNPGTWLLHCHLNQHVIDGMETVYTVTNECLSWRYGPECAHMCGWCRDGEPCDQATGRCPNGCQHGYSGANCDSKLSVDLCIGAHWRDGVGYNAFPGDCSKFVECVRTEGVITRVLTMECSGGLHWDRELLVCNYSDQAGCIRY